MSNEIRRDAIGIDPWYAWLVALPSNLWWDATANAWVPFASMVPHIVASGQEMALEGNSPNQTGSQFASLPGVAPPAGTQVVRAFIASSDAPGEIGGVVQWDGGTADSQPIWIINALATLLNPSGSGPIPYPFQVTDCNGSPLYNVAVTVYVDNNGEPGAQVAGTGTVFTNQSGVAIFWLSAGSYWFNCVLSGVEFTPNPVLETVVLAMRT